jgi:hypothetical protein
MERDPQHAGAMGDTPAAGEPLPSLPARFVAVFISPGRLVEQVAREPKWAGVLLLGALLVALSVSLIPTEILMEANRQAAMERGRELPEMGAQVLRVMRIVTPILTFVATLIMTAFMAGVYAVVFAFVLGDEGRYVQYLAVVAHANLIAVVFALIITPLRISTGDPQLTLNLGTFLPFLPDGYVSTVLRYLDLTQIWSSLVIAQGAHAIDRRRSFGSAAGVGISILLLFAMVIAFIVQR